VNREVHTDTRYAEVEEAFKRWQQGDCILNSEGLVYRNLRATPDTTAAQESLLDKSDILVAETPGLVVDGAGTRADAMVTSVLDIVLNANAVRLDVRRS
jgi:hypothetical protein